jgi:hypothetical protein
MYLALHLWAHAVLALTYHPDLLKSASGIETPFSKSMSRNVQLALASSRQISECMVFADLVAKETYVSHEERLRADFIVFDAVSRPASLRGRVSKHSLRTRSAVDATVWRWFRSSG